MTPTPIRSALAAEIRARIARDQVEQAPLAAALGITPSALSLKLAAQRPLHVDEVHTLARLLNTTAAELMAAAETQTTRSTR